MSNDDIRQQLLDEAHKKPVREFFQIDGFADHKNSWDQWPEVKELYRDSDALYTGTVNELRNTGHDGCVAVRVQIAADANEDDIRRLLTRIVDDVDDLLASRREQQEEALLARAGIHPQIPF